MDEDSPCRNQNPPIDLSSVTLQRALCERGQALADPPRRTLSRPSTKGFLSIHSGFGSGDTDTSVVEGRVERRGRRGNRATVGGLRGTDEDE